MAGHFVLSQLLSCCIRHVWSRSVFSRNIALFFVSFVAVIFNGTAVFIEANRHGDLSKMLPEILSKTKLSRRVQVASPCSLL